MAITNLTENTKVDLREDIDKKVDDFDQFKENKTKLPQNYSTLFAIAVPLIKVPAPILIKEINQKYYGDYTNLDYSAGNLILPFFAGAITKSSDLNFANISKLTATFSGSWSVQPNANTFASDFSFKIVGVVGISTNNSEDPIINVDLGTIQYTASTNLFSYLLAQSSIEISTSDPILGKKIIDGMANIYGFASILGSGLSTSQLAFLNNINIRFNNNIQINIVEFGLASNTISRF
jgi:hypothetical protein